MRETVTRYAELKDLDIAGDESDHLLGLVEEICCQSGEEVREYLWRVKYEAEEPISTPDELRNAVEEQVASDLRMAADDLRLTLRLSRPD